MTKVRKTAVVTGASRGIGLATCEELIQNGYSVLGVSRKMAFDGKIKKMAEFHQQELYEISADISKPDDQDRIREYTKSIFGKLDLLVNNAGVAPLIREDVLNMSYESYERVMQINLFGPVFLTNKLHSLLKAGDRPAIVFVTSISASTASVNRAEYCISKSGLSMYAQVLAKRLASENISVFEIRPGVIDTDMIQSVRQTYLEMAESETIPQHRLGKPEDVAVVVRALVSGDFNYAQGLIVEVSGGMQIRSL